MRAEIRLPRGCLRGCAAIFAAVVALGLAASGARADTRSLKLYFLHTGEKAEITFEKDGKYLPGGLEKLNRFLRDWRRNEPTKMDPHLFDLIWEVYQKSGSRDYIHVVSGYRSPATNAMLRKRTRGVAKHSQHMLGRAMDFFLPDVPLAKLRRIGLQLQEGGVGYYPTSGSPFVHMDVGSVRHWPRMSRKELLAIFPQGRTLHIPTDGKPLPGYDIALANYQKRMAGRTDSYAVASVSNTASPGGQAKRKGLLASLFGLGGGADAEEDVASETDTAASAPDASPRQTTPATKQMVVAALPETNVPIPMAAPRPPATPVMADASAQKLPADKLMAALDMPAPSPRPAIQAAYRTDTASGVPVPPAAAFAGPAREARDDQIRNVLLATLVEQRLQDSSRQTNLTAYAGKGAGAEFPVPTFAPENGKASRFAVLPQKVPAPEVRGASAPKEGRLRPVVQLASLQASEPLRRQALRLASTGVASVRTAPRQAKPGPADEPPAPKAVVLPVDPGVAEWAFRVAHPPVIRSSKPGARSAMYSAPSVVLTAGFASAPLEPDPHRFTGTAVTFLSIARFSANN